MRVLLQEIINPNKCINNSLFRECSMQIFFIITKQLTNSKNERKIQALCVGIFYYFKRFFAFSVFRKLCCELTISTIRSCHTIADFNLGWTTSSLSHTEWKSQIVAQYTKPIWNYTSAQLALPENPGRASWAEV